MRISRLVSISVLAIFIIFTSACSKSISVSQNAGNDNRVIANTSRQDQAATDIGGMLKEGPGKYAGSNYNEQKVQSELKQIPKNASANEIYGKIVNLLAEDYKPVVDQLDKFDTTYTVKGTPADKVKVPGGGGTSSNLNVEFLVDASGSMAEKVDGRTKMELAKAAVIRFASTLPSYAKVSLRVYGHKGSGDEKDKNLSCQSTDQVYPFSAYDERKFNQALSMFQPTGWTPIAGAIKAAQQDFASVGGNSNNIIYIVSDGIETCGGNPVEAAKELHNSNIKAIVNIIGFKVGNADQQGLKAVAEAGGGQFQTVNNEQDLREYFDEQNTKLWLDWSAWGSESWVDVGDQWAKKEQQLDKINSQFISLIDTENNHMNKALDFLNGNSQISSDVLGKVSDLVQNRYHLLGDYQTKRYDELDTILTKNRRTLQEEIDKKANQMKSKFN